MSAERRHSGRFRQAFEGALVAGDVLWVLCAYGASYTLRFHSKALGAVDKRFVDPLHYWYVAPLVVGTFFVVFKWMGLYKGRRGLSVVDEFSVLFRGSLLSLLILSGLAFFYREFLYSTKVFLVTAGLSLGLLLVWRTLMRYLELRLRRRGLGVARTLLVGGGPTAERLAARLKANAELGYELVGFVDDLAGPRARARAKTLGLKHLGKLASAAQAADRAACDCVLIALPGSLSHRTHELMLELGGLGLDLRIVSDLYGVITSPLAVDDIHGIPVFALKEAPLDRRHNRFLKRAFDLLLVLPGLVLAAPLLALLALGVKLSSRGPVLFSQERVGRRGRHFQMLKFRSMRQDAEKSGPGWTVKDDPRRTAFGRFLRRSSLDELPQVFNVLKGDMSLVGPRPERPVYVGQFSKKIQGYLQRHDVRPGISGWAQVHGWRGDTSIEERTAFDLYYVENWSLSLDLLILLKTGLELFEHETAY